MSGARFWASFASRLRHDRRIRLAVVAMSDLSVTPSGSRALRLLFLVPFPPRHDALHGGARAAAAIIAALSTRHEVAACYLRSDDESTIDATLAGRCALVEQIDLGTRISLKERLARRLSPYLGTPQWAAYTWSSAVQSRVRQIARAWKPDVIHFEYHVMGQYLPAFQGIDATRILTEYEPGTTAAEHLASRPGTSRIKGWVERRSWARFERRMLASMSAVIAFTERDREVLLAGRTATPIVCIPFRLAVPPAPLAATGSGDVSNLVFVGSFIHPPNLDAAMRLARVIYPGVLALVPAATLTIIGANPPKELCAVESDRIRITGRVPDVSDYLALASVVVVPLRQGGGMRVKVVEALAAGKAVVASSLAVDGLSVQDGVHLLIADSDREFIAAIVSLLCAPERRRALGLAARTWASVSQTVAPWVAQYDALYESIRGRSANAG